MEQGSQLSGKQDAEEGEETGPGHSPSHLLLPAEPLLLFITF